MTVRTRLFLMMVLQLAVWGAWAPKLFPYMGMLGFQPWQQSLVGSCWGIASVVGLLAGLAPPARRVARLDVLGQVPPGALCHRDRARHCPVEGDRERRVGSERGPLSRRRVAGVRLCHVAFWLSILRVSRGSANGSLSFGRMPPSIARWRSSSALNSAPSRIMLFEIQSQTRNTITPPSAP